MRIVGILSALILSLCVGAAELKTTKTNIKTELNELRFFPQGAHILSYQGKRVAHISFSFASKGGWFNFSSQAIKTIYDNKEAGLWKYSAEIPSDKAKTEMATVSETIEVTPMNTVDFECSWDFKTPANILDIGLFMDFPMAFALEKEIYVGEQPVKVENSSKFGWLNNNIAGKEIIFFKDDPQRELKIAVPEKCRLVFSSTQDKTFSIRFYPAANATNVKVSMTIK